MAGQQAEMDDADKKKVKQADLERSLQEVIQSIVEGSDSLVSIHDFNSADFSASAVSVTLYTEQGNDISQEQRDGIVRTMAAWRICPRITLPSISVPTKLKQRQ